MNDYNYGGAQVAGSDMDQGLRKFMLGTYQWMIAAMGISAIVGWFWSKLLFVTVGDQIMGTDLYMALYASPVQWAIWLAPMIFIWVMQSQYHKLSPMAAKVTLVVFSALIGVWLTPLATILLSESPALFAKVFLMSSALYASICLFGYVTKKNLSGIGTFAAMAFFGVIIAMVVNMLIFKSPMFDLIVSCIGLVLVAGITAWQVQAQKQIYYAIGHDQGEAQKASIFGAIGLYMSFINIFLLLLRIMGRD